MVLRRMVHREEKALGGKTWEKDAVWNFPYGMRFSGAFYTV